MSTTPPLQKPVARPCTKCGQEKDLIECWNCGGEVYVDHDCGEDVCCCAYPEDNVVCDICAGRGMNLVCTSCYPEVLDHG